MIGNVGGSRSSVVCGRMADLASLASSVGSYNTIDGSTIEWLARQRPPGPWISDGLINGIGGRVSTKMIIEVMGKVRSARIRRYPDLASLTNAHRHLFHPGWPVFNGSFSVVFPAVGTNACRWRESCSAIRRGNRVSLSMVQWPLN
jgi:hypothetical protein